MSYNNALNLNDCITELQTVEDIHSEIDSLELFINQVDLSSTDKERLQKILTRLLIKHTKQEEKINKVANKLNKICYY